MSEFHVNVVRIGEIEKHPNADALSITRVHGGYPVLFRSGEYKPGDLAVYVPIDSIVPADDPRWDFLAGHRRIRAKRLRGVFSMGLLTAADPTWNEGDDVAAALRMEKYDPEEPAHTGGARVIGEGDEPDPGLMPVYDIEGLRRHRNALADGEEVVLTEKIHGENARYLFDGERLWVGSHKRIKKDRPDSQWWQAARACDLETKLREVPGLAFYGEVHGYTKGFAYGVAPGSRGLRFFDALDTKTRMWLDAGEFFCLCMQLGLPTVPVLYRGPWSWDLVEHANGSSTLGAHIREGFVVRPVRERSTHSLPRVILKMHGEAFLLKGAA